MVVVVVAVVEVVAVVVVLCLTRFIVSEIFFKIINHVFVYRCAAGG